jgi:hypothetical protein
MNFIGIVLLCFFPSVFALRQEEAWIRQVWPKMNTTSIGHLFIFMLLLCADPSFFHSPFHFINQHPHSTLTLPIPWFHPIRIKILINKWIYKQYILQISIHIHSSFVANKMKKWITFLWEEKKPLQNII